MGLIARLLGRTPPTSDLPAYDFKRNPYKAKRPWPPDFSKLSHQQQFRFERKYRIRTQLKFARPTFMKVTKLAQWGSIIGVTVYMVLFYEPPPKPGQSQDEMPLNWIRERYKQVADSIWTHNTNKAKIEEAQKAIENMRRERDIRWKEPPTTP